MGRSDSTLNRHGVRIGTAEIYRIVEALAPINDSLVVNLDLPGGHSFMPLFVTLKDGQPLDDALEKQIRRALKEQGSPRHVPDKIYAVPAIPFTLTGKKLEVPVRKILLGQAAEKVASRDAMANPQALDWFVGYAGSTRDYPRSGS
jgi:acetoacetyl-CoA synthetase